MDQQIEQKIVERGQEFFNSISGEAPSIFNKGWWTGKVMDWSMKNEDFKVQLFRFVDVLPYLNTSESLLRHIREYFASSGSEVPSVLRWGAGKAGLGGALTAKIMGGAIRSNIESMGRQFIIGQNVKEAMGGLAKLRKDGFAFTVDLLGEASVNEEESDAYAAGYHEVLDALAEEQKKWPALSGNGPDNGMDWGSMPKVNISIKPSALYSRANPVALEDSVEGIYRRLAPLYQKTIDMGGFMCIDMEQLKYREITVELFKRLRSAPEFRHYPHLCLVQQAYLKDTEQAVRDLIAWARKEKLPIALRLVKGAYWDAETVFAKQCDWPVPVWTHKPESDLAHEKISRLILENHDIVYFACASHNVRSIAAVMEYARQLDVPEGRYEFQVLYGMAEPVRKGLRNVAGRVRLYCPYGKLIPGMAYLVRRLLENTANESFLRQSFADGAAVELLMENPAVTLERELAARQEKAPPHEEGPLPPFRNEPPVAFTIPLYTMFSKIGLLNTKIPVTLACVLINVPLIIWFLISFFQDLPEEVEESAKVDGATEWQLFRKIVLPLVAPGIAAVAMLSFMYAWNEYTYTVIFTRSPSNYTVPLALSVLNTEDNLTNFGLVAAGGVVSVIPITLFVIFAQNYLISGLSSGAVKE